MTMDNSNKLFVWDFHGTLEEGNERAVTELSNLALAELGYPSFFTDEICTNLYGRKWSEYFEKVLPEGNDELFNKLQEIAFSISLNNPHIIAKYIKPTIHSHEVLKIINNSHTQILISNTTSDALEMFIETVEMKLFFPHEKRFAVDGHRQFNTKQEVLKNYLRGKNFEKIIVIGDSKKDIELANQVGAISYLYSHPYKEHEDICADYKIKDLREVLKEI